MKSMKKLLCCTRQKTKHCKVRAVKRENLFAVEREREEKKRTGEEKKKLPSAKSFSIRDGVTTTPFVDSDSCSSHGMDDEMEFEVYSSGIQMEAEVSDRVSISTRARYTYPLEDFEKNAMIIFAQADGREDFVAERIRMLQSRFGDLRFEAEVHLDLTKDEMETKLEEFFSTDFTAVGAVAVVVLAKEGEAGLLDARTQRYHESMLLRWLTQDQPSALRGKPKIYITEANRTGVTADTGVYSLLLNCYYHDVIGVHIPVIIDRESHPLKILCEQLGGDDFLEHVFTASHVAETTLPELKDRPIQVVSTLQMRLRFEKKSVTN